MNNVLEQRYQMLCNTPSDIYEHLPTFVRMVDDLRATRVIELGVRYGVSTIAWLYALQNKGILWSVDCSFPVAGPGSDINLLDPQGELGVMDHWMFLLGNSRGLLTLDALPDEVDIVFIDTNHVYEETLQELEHYYPRVRQYGRIVLHDTAIEITGNATTPQPPYPVLTAMREFCEKYDLVFTNISNCSGLGIIACDAPPAVEEPELAEEPKEVEWVSAPDV